MMPTRPRSICESKLWKVSMSAARRRWKSLKGADLATWENHKEQVRTALQGTAGAVR